MARIQRLVAAFLVAALAFVLLPPIVAEAQEGPPELPEQASPYARGTRAIEKLGDRLPTVANAYGLRAGQLRAMLLADNTLFIDNGDELVYFDLLAPAEEAPAAASDTSFAPPVSGPEFQLASNPGADKTIYLDFNGSVTEGTTWNSQNAITTIVSPPFDTDGNPDAWSAAELDVIARSWAVVAEDFAPWDVNVTTIDPGSEALRRSGAGDSQWGVRVLITNDNFLACGCGGVAYIGAFDDVSDEPAFVFNSSFVGVSEAITHEVGHTLLLAHDGTSTAGYYQGHDSADTPGWAPIMGAAYYQPVSQWSQQEFFDANNAGSDANFGYGRDDIAIISSLSNGNNFGLKSDDHGDTPATATVITEPSITLNGVIGTRQDRDVFRFSTNGGAAIFAATPAAADANLDIDLTIKNSTGVTVATNNPTATLDASLDVALTAGDYTVEVDGRGVGSPTSTSPTGYTDYASLGQYTLNASIDGLGEVDLTPPATPTGLTAAAANGIVELSWTPNTEPDLANYEVLRSSTAGGSFSEVGTTTNPSFSDPTAPTGVSYYVVVAVDLAGNTSTASNEASVTIDEPTSGTLRYATGESLVAGTIVGGFAATTDRGGAVQIITESESGGKPSKRHDLAEHRWSIPAASGNQILTVVATATDAGDADEGFSIEWSNDASTWTPLATVRQGSPVDATFALGGPTGTVFVRAIDTNRSSGERQLDSVTVDFLQLQGDGEVVTPIDPTTAFASISTSQEGAGQGRHYGVATVTVVDDQGGLVADATVTVHFSGDFNETATATTDAAGLATIRTSSSVRKPNVVACVDELQAAGLTWSLGSEAC